MSQAAVRRRVFGVAGVAGVPRQEPAAQPEAQPGARGQEEEEEVRERWGEEDGPGLKVCSVSLRNVLSNVKDVSQFKVVFIFIR